MSNTVTILKDDETPRAQVVAPAEKPRTGQNTVKVTHDIDGIIARAAERYKLDPLLLRAIIQRESGGKVDAVGPDTHAQPGQKAKGLMQLMDGTAKDMGVTDPFDPEQNIMGGARYFRQLLDHPAAGGDTAKALLHYVGGRDPKQWGAQSFAYPHFVLEEYRKLGGRLMDPAVPKGTFVERAANASLPFDGASRLVLGKGPDLSQGLSGPQAGRPVGAKIKDWWNSISPARERHQKSMANYADENPLLAPTADVLGGLPATVALGGAVNKGLSFAGEIAPTIAPMMKFLGGTAGRGLPGTGEGASLGVRALSGGAQGALQGAIGGAAMSHLSPDTPWYEDVALGGAVGGVLGTATPLATAGWNQMLFGKRIDPTTAQLFKDAKSGTGMPKVPLEVDPGQVNNFSLDPMQFSRVAGEMVGEPTPFVVERGKLSRARAVLGQMFDDATPKLSGAVDREFIREFQDLAQLYRTDPNVKKALEQLPQYKAFTKKLSAALHLDGGVLSGEDIHAWTKFGKTPGLVSQLSNSSDDSTRKFGQGLRRILEESLDRGTAQKVQYLTAQGALAEAAEVQKALSMFREAKSKYRLLEPIEASLDPVTQRVEPSALLRKGEARGGEIEKLGRLGLAADPAARAPSSGMAVPYTGIAAGLSMAAHDPVTTGKAVLATVAANKLGQGAKNLLRKVPGYQNALLNRSVNMFQPGDFANALGVAVPAAGVLSALSSQGQGQR